VRDYGVAIGLGEELKAWHETEGLEFPSGWQNDLAAAYMNRGNTLQGQGDLSGAVRDYGVAIGLGEELLFARQFAPVIPDLAKAFYNVILLIRKDDLPPDIRPEEWQTRVETFLNRLGQLTDIEQLPGFSGLNGYSGSERVSVSSSYPLSYSRYPDYNGFREAGDGRLAGCKLPSGCLRSQPRH